MKQDADIPPSDSAHMQIRLYIDEDAMARALVQGLRARGVDVTTVVDEGMNERDDNSQLQRATQQRRVIYTFNVGDFCKLHRDHLACRQESRWHNSGLQAAIFSRRTNTALNRVDRNEVSRGDER